MIRLLLIMSYIVSCLRLWVAPWKYFQLNSPFFNEQRDIFSKLDMDQRIPEQWRLPQFLDIGNKEPSSYPVFVKPEWGQNSRGISRADDTQTLQKIRLNRGNTKLNYLIQEAAPGKREFEIFIIPSANINNAPAVISVTETINHSDEDYPVNGIYNPSTGYKDISNELSRVQMLALWHHLKPIGSFRISRFGIRADSIEALFTGEFHIIEVNLFLPMPLVLLCENRCWKTQLTFCIHAMWHLAKVTKSIPPSQVHKSVFFKKLKHAKSLKLTSNIRSTHMRSNNEHA